MTPQEQENSLLSPRGPLLSLQSVSVPVLCSPLLASLHSRLSVSPDLPATVQCPSAVCGS